MRKNVCFAIVFLGMVLTAILGVASAEEVRNKLSGCDEVLSFDVVRDGSVAYASFWTSYAVDQWDVAIEVSSVDPYTGEVRTSMDSAGDTMSNGTTLVRRAFGGEFLYKVTFDNAMYIATSHDEYRGTSMSSHTMKRDLSWDWSLPEGIPTPTVAPTAAPSPTQVVTATPTPTQMVYPASDHITWARPFFGYAPNAEEQLEINRLLYEKGLDCAVDFVNMGVLTEEENVLWLEHQVAAGTVPDILASGIWTDSSTSGKGSIGACEYVRNWYQPLQEYFDTEDGKKLKNCFSETSWQDVTTDGNAYVLPLISSSYNLYLLVNNDYAARFEGFDGTYESLMKIYDSIGDPTLKIVIPGVDQRIVSAMIGYSSFGQLTYDTKTHQILPYRGFTDAAKMWNTLYKDISEGRISDRNLSKEVDGTVLAEYVIGAGYAGKAEEGYTPIRIGSVNYSPSYAFSLGIYRDSPQKELALKILAVCMEDPEIRVLLRSGYTTAEEIRMVEELRGEEEVFELAGFIPTLTDEQWAAYKKLTLKFAPTSQESSVYVHDNGVRLAKKFNAATMYREVFSDDVDALIEELNRQIAEYLAGSGRQQ